jgi:hypothetical protein
LPWRCRGVAVALPWRCRGVAVALEGSVRLCGLEGAVHGLSSVRLCGLEGAVHGLGSVRLCGLEGAVHGLSSVLCGELWARSEGLGEGSLRPAVDGSAVVLRCSQPLRGTMQRAVRCEPLRAADLESCRAR